MKKEESHLLDSLGKQPGFKVPENFFENFNTRLAESLPEVTITETGQPTSWWVKARPYLYLAATFAGVWCIMQVFTHLSNTNADQMQRISEIAAGIPNDDNADQLIMNGVATDYDLLDYEDSIQADIQQQELK